MIKVNKGVDLKRLVRLGFSKTREGVYSLKIPDTFRFSYCICIAEEDIFIDVYGMYRGDESMDFEEGLEKLYFRNEDKRPFVEKVIQKLVDADIVVDTDGRFQKRDEFKEMVERFSVLLPSYKCRRENHENCNNVFGVNLRELFEKAKNAGYVCIGVCKEPEYSKPDCWGLVFEDAATFESFWYHCWNFNAERLYAEARVRTGKETDKDVIEYVERWSEE